MKSTLKIDQTKVLGKLKPMNAVNNGPVRAPKAQARGNFDAYAAAGFPYARLHDANLCYSYGGPHVVDITAIFPNFDADENNPDSYDFLLTDRYLSNIVDAGTKVFYRLGQSIEHWAKKYDIFAPKDFHKWARICEHIILHYNVGKSVLDYVKNPEDFAFVNGSVELPKKAGLGVEVNKELVLEENEHPHHWKNPVWRHADGSIAEW